MKLSDLLTKVEYQLVAGNLSTDVKSLEYHSKNVKKDGAFFAIDGYLENGSEYIEEAVERGAAAIILSEKTKFDIKNFENITFLTVKDVRKALAYMSCEFYNNPSEEMQVIGVTGTKGKTSVAFMIRHILEAAGIKTGLIGTVYKGYEGHFHEADSTTPQAPEIQCLLRQMKDAGCKAVVMEVSSQGLKHCRVCGIDFNIGVFTNISPDHIGGGEHKDYEEYLSCKCKLFDLCSRAIINGDDKTWLCKSKKTPLKQKIYYGTDNEFDLVYEGVNLEQKKGALGVSFYTRAKAPFGNEESHKVTLNLPGKFNAENALAAISVARALGVPWDIIVKSLESVKIPGRAEIVPLCDDFTVMVDYAHNGIALQNLLQSLRKYNPKRLMVVMGCGGNRDKNRRFSMGKAAFELADYIIITSDNPRNEPPEDIIKDITSVMNFCNKVILAIPDRKEAIRRAIFEGKKGDIIVIAGKGHETYQIIGDEIIDFDDKAVVLSCGKEKR